MNGKNAPRLARIKPSDPVSKREGRKIVPTTFDAEDVAFIDRLKKERRCSASAVIRSIVGEARKAAAL